MYDPILAREAKRLLQTYQVLDSNSLRLLDPLGNRIIQRVIELGLLACDACHIEWQGVDEFGVIPIFYGSGECIQVYENGAVEQF